MNILKKKLLFLLLVLLASDAALAQAPSFKELHKVKRKETIFGIARDNGLTVEELIRANPEMNTPGYELRKGDYIKIPFPSAAASQQPAVAEETPAPIAMPTKPESVKTDIRQRELRVGVMLPLHNLNGDGRRMTEYYRGVLMACDSLRQNGISVDMCAWNVSEESDISTVLADEHAADRDLIIGPLYSKQVKALTDFTTEHGIRLLIPFSINAPEALKSPLVFQVFQNGNVTNNAFASRLMAQFADAHVVIVDCNDSTSTKGPFTTVLRRRLEAAGRKYSITNLRSSEAAFQKSFSHTQPNVVVLNTSRSVELNIAFAKLSGVALQNPQMRISMFGYPEWLMYTRTHLDNFYRFDTYIPSTYFMDPTSPRTDRLKLKYRWNFHQDMQPYHQRFAATGFDQAFFFLKGLHMYGKQFTGASGLVGYTPFQTPLHFEATQDGGHQNRAMVIVHYTHDHTVDVTQW